MTRKTNVKFRTHTEQGRKAITNFLYSLKDELYFLKRAVAEETS